ncbi:ferritin family protein [Candidatus Bipolaricaulota bacterium]|nr:ferritin family protein [Candidatus Bipolaricaulota bacterium]MCF7890165.1 ferritin family protein [Candidatus Bipolaricaulota bacterium]
MNREKDSSPFDLFNFEVSLQELLGRAVRTELEEADIYRNLLEKDLPDETAPIIERFITQEENHEEKLRSTFDDFFPDEEIPLPERSGVEVPEETSGETTPRKIIEEAIEAERNAEKFYRELIDEFEDKEVRRLLGFLASNEREHYEILRVELNKLK